VQLHFRPPAASSALRAFRIEQAVTVVQQTHAQVYFIAAAVL